MRNFIKKKLASASLILSLVSTLI